jgi:hypothetical protein
VQTEHQVPVQTPVAKDSFFLSGGYKQSKRHISKSKHQD